MKADRIEVIPAKGGFVWHFRAANGRIRANNEVFASRAGAEQAVKGVVRNIAGMMGIAPTFVRHRDGDRTILMVQAGEFVL